MINVVAGAHCLTAKAWGGCRNHRALSYDFTVQKGESDDHRGLFLFLSLLK